MLNHYEKFYKENGENEITPLIEQLIGKGHDTFGGFHDLMKPIVKKDLERTSALDPSGVVSVDVTVNHFFHMYMFERNHKKIYEITEDLAYLLKNTHLKKVLPDLVKTPFPEILLTFPPNMFKLFAEPSGWHRANSAFVHFAEPNMVLSVFIGSLPNEKSINQFDDATYYINIPLKQGKDVYESLRDCVENHCQSRKELDANNEIAENIFDFIINCLLYITGADSEIKRVGDPSEEKLKRVKSPGKRKKLLRKSRLPKYVIGGSIKLSREEKELYSGATGTGTKHTTKYIVQGHWRGQAHGYKKSLRKQIWIRPFWKGQEIGNIINKTHRVT